MILTGTRFGDIEFSEEDIIHFAEGLIGFPNSHSFVLLCAKPGSEFRWLQSLDEPALAFLCTDPTVFVPEYAPTMPLRHARDLGMTEETPRLVLTTAAIPRGKPEDMTLNLAGPIIINAEERRGRQIVLEDGAYTIKHRVFPKAERAKEAVAA